MKKILTFIGALLIGLFLLNYLLIGLKFILMVWPFLITDSLNVSITGINAIDNWIFNQKTPFLVLLFYMAGYVIAVFMLWVILKKGEYIK